jgi:hypothetical protein
MRSLQLFTIALGLRLAGSAGFTPEVAAQTRSVVINTVRLEDETVRRLEQQYQVRIKDGDYWYDRASGAWGMHGGPTRGFILPGLALGGALRPDASNGHTGVFINGRQLHQYDVMALLQLTPVYPGRYWMDAYGNVGVEGGPAMLNLVELAHRTSARGGVGSVYTRDGSMFGNDGNGCLVFNDPSSGTSASSGC